MSLPMYRTEIFPNCLRGHNPNDPYLCRWPAPWEIGGVDIAPPDPPLRHVPHPRWNTSGDPKGMMAVHPDDMDRWLDYIANPKPKFCACPCHDNDPRFMLLLRATEQETL